MAYVKSYGHVCDVINCSTRANHVVIDKQGQERYYYCENHRLIALDMAHEITKAEYRETLSD